MLELGFNQQLPLPESLRKTVDLVLSRRQLVVGRGEEATKTAIILPILSALGYDIHDLGEVCPEFDADFSIKKMGQKEKVDYCILVDNIPRIFIEVKAAGTELDGHEGQLARYYNAVATVDLAILTNGLEWRLYTDTKDANRLDNHPFHCVKLDSIAHGLETLALFAKNSINNLDIRKLAIELAYTATIADFFEAQIDLKEQMPNDYLTRWVLKKETNIFDGTLTAGVIERFQPIIKNALNRVLYNIALRMMNAANAELNRPQPIPDNQSDKSIQQPPQLVDADNKDTHQSLNQNVKNTIDLPIESKLYGKYRGRDIIVEVVNEGFLCDGKIYNSLSAAAKAVTGYNMNGPDFFGLRD